MDHRLQMMGDRQEPQDCRREGEGPSGIVLKQFWDWSKWIMVIISETTATYYYLREEIAERDMSLYVMICHGLIFFTFLADLALMFTSYLLSRGYINKGLYVSIVKILIYITGILTMLTSASLLLLLNPNYCKLVAVLMLLVMTIVITDHYKGFNTGQAHYVIDYEDHQPELKCIFDLSASVTVVAFGGMIATISNYFKNFPIDDDQFPIENLEAYIFLIVIFGLLEMLVTTVPPSLPHHNARLRFITIFKVLSYLLFILLALTGLSVAIAILEDLILLPLVLEFIAFVVFLSMDFDQEDGTSQAHNARGHESEPDTFSIAMATFSFAALMMTVYSGHFSSEEDFHLEMCIFFMSSAFTFSQCWMLLAFRRPRTQSLVIAVKVLTNCTVVLMALGLLQFSLLGTQTSARVKRQY